MSREEEERGTDEEYRGSCTVLKREELYIGSCIVQVCQLCFRRRVDDICTEIVMPCP